MADGLDNLNAATTQSALDFAGLGALRGKAQQKSDQATRETATQFEAMFIQEMLKSMRATVEKSELTGSDAEDTFTQMYDRELSVMMAKRNSLGIADMLVKAIERQGGAAPVVKLKPEPMPLKSVKEGIALHADQLPMKLVRPEKFNLKARVSPVPGKGAD